MSTLYRDYRPQNFSEVLGQKYIKLTLQNEIKANNIAQAFLFCGPRAVGKTTMARILAKSINCLQRKNGDYEPCGQCVNCLSIMAGTNLDIIEIDAASNTGVDNVRDNIISFSRLSPNQAKYKVFIIDEVHMLSPSAFNALLKIIEEPPTYVVFILCTTEIHKVPSTIISRCERFDFQRINLSEVVIKLKKISQQEKIEVEDSVLEAVARNSGGHLRDAESLLGQVFALGQKKITLEQAELVIPHSNHNDIVTFLEFLLNKDISKAISLINNLVDSGIQLRYFLADLINILRKIIIGKLSPDLAFSLGLNLGEALELKISKLSEQLSIEQLLVYTQRFLLVHSEKNQLIPQLPIELAIIDLSLSNSMQVIKPKNDLSVAALAVKLNPDSNVNDKKVPVNKSQNFNSESQINTEISPEKVQFSCQEVLEKWPEFLIKIKKHNHSLSFVLQNCEPQAIENSALKLVFRYKFHQDRVKDETIRETIQETLAEVFGSKISVIADLDENLEIRKTFSSKNTESEVSETVTQNSDINTKETELVQGSSSNMNNLLKIFGGEVIS